jgi:hypothetical protein
MSDGKNPSIFLEFVFLMLDAKRLNPSMTLGWTILAEK